MRARTSAARRHWRQRRRDCPAVREHQAGREPGEVLGALAIGEQAVVTDAVEAAGQYVDEEAADELIAGQRHDLDPLPSLGAIVLPPEGDAVVVEGDQPAVGDGDAVSVAAEIGEYRLRP